MSLLVYNGTRLGFMSFFIRASVEALKVPCGHASIDGNDVVYHGYQDVSVAEYARGLVAPVIRLTV